MLDEATTTLKHLAAEEGNFYNKYIHYYMHKG